MACTKPTFAGETPGEACQECGHTNLVHPGPHNSAVNACVVCELVAMKEQD